MPAQRLGICDPGHPVVLAANSCLAMPAQRLGICDASERCPLPGIRWHSLCPLRGLVSVTVWPWLCSSLCESALAMPAQRLGICDQKQGVRQAIQKRSLCPLRGLVSVTRRYPGPCRGGYGLAMPAQRLGICDRRGVCRETR